MALRGNGPSDAMPSLTGPRSADWDASRRDLPADRATALRTYAAAQLGVPLDDPEQVAHQLHATRSTIICTPGGMILRDIGPCTSVTGNAGRGHRHTSHYHTESQTDH